MYTVIWFQVFLYNNNNFQIDVFDPAMGPLQVRPLWFRIITMKNYSTLPRDPEQEPHHQMQFSFLFKTAPFYGGGGLIPLQEIQLACSQPRRLGESLLKGALG